MRCISSCGFELRRDASSTVSGMRLSTDLLSDRFRSLATMLCVCCLRRPALRRCRKVLWAPAPLLPLPAGPGFKRHFSKRCFIPTPELDIAGACLPVTPGGSGAAMPRDSGTCSSCPFMQEARAGCGDPPYRTCTISLAAFTRKPTGGHGPGTGGSLALRIGMRVSAAKEIYVRVPCTACGTLHA